MAADREIVAYLIKLEDRMSKELAAVSKRAEKAEKAFDRLERQQKDQTRASERQAQVMGKLKTGLAAVAAAATAYAAASVAAAKSVITVSSQMEDYEAQLTVLLKSSDKAKERLEELFEIGSTTPFQLQDLVAAEQRMVSFGVETDKMRMGLMDLVGSLGGNLVDASLAVSKSFAAGKAASMGLRQSYALLFNDVERRAEELGGASDIDNWRTAMIDALNDVNGVVAGGTAGLARTFSGQMSNVADQWFKFKKKIGDAGLFDYAKMGVAELIKGLNDGEQAGTDLASMMSGVLITSIDGTVRAVSVLSGAMVGIVMAVKFIIQGFSDLMRVVAQSRVAFLELQQSLDFFGDLEGDGLLAKKFAADMDRATASVREAEAQLEAYNRDMEILGDNFMALGRISGTMDELKAKYDAMQESKAAAAQTDFQDDFGTSDPDAIPDDESPVLATEAAAAPIPVTIAGDDSGMKGAAKEEKDPAAEFLKQVAKDAEKAKAATEAMGRATMTESEKLKADLDKLGQQMAQGGEKAKELGLDLGGPEIQGYFDSLRQQIDATGDAYASALEQEMRASLEAAGAAMELAAATLEQSKAAKQAALGQGLEAGVGVLETGGMNLLAGAGPGGAAAAGLIGLGEQGKQAYDDEVDEAAKEAAKKRQDSMRKEAEAMKKQGFSADEIAAAGLGSDAIAQAGKVTDADKAAAAEGIDQDEVMAEQVAAVVQGIIDGVEAIIRGLPEILQTLIPMLLIDLPTALIEAIPELIEELIPVLIFELPKALLQMVWKLVPMILKLLFRDLWVSMFKGFKKGFLSVWGAIKKFFKSVFSFGILQTGGYVPKTGMNLLHQGERVIPATGAGTQTATKGLQAFTGTPGPSLTVNTNVVDPDSIGALGRMIDAELGAWGRSSVPIFGETAPTTTI